MVIDCHAHYVGPHVVAAVRSGKFGEALAWTEDGRFRFPQTLSRPFLARMTDLEGRIEHMNILGISMQILSTWIDIYGYDLPEGINVEYHRLVNQGLADAVHQYPERFRFVASVPLPYGGQAADVLEEAVTDLGAVGAMIGTNILGRNLDDAAFEPFWERCSDLGVPVILHPCTVAASDRLQHYYLENLLGNPFDTTIAAASLVFGGVLDRHPRLRILLLHGGGYFPFAVGRLDHGYVVRPEARTIQEPPSSYLKRFFYDVIVYQPALLSVLAQQAGADRIVLGTDYPFDMEPDDAVALATNTLGLESGVLDRNALALFGEKGGLS